MCAEAKEATNCKWHWVRGDPCWDMEVVLPHGWGIWRQPPCLIASAWGENLLFLIQCPLTQCHMTQTMTHQRQVQQKGNSVMPFWSCWRGRKRGQRRETRRAKAREERLLNLLEKIVEKIWERKEIFINKMFFKNVMNKNWYNKTVFTRHIKGPILCKTRFLWSIHI